MRTVTALIRLAGGDPRATRPARRPARPAGTAERVAALELAAAQAGR